MFPAPFDYYRAKSTDDALEALARFGEDARILAGGQSLIPAMRFRLARPAALVDINAIAEIEYLRESDGALTVGAAARDRALETSAIVGERYALLADVSAVVADPVVRQMGTVVGSLCHNDPAGDWPVAALASRAELSVRGQAGTRRVAIDDFIVDSFTTAIGPGEMAIEVRFPTPGARTSGSFQKIERKVGDFATASAAAQITLAADGTISGAGIAIGAVATKALRVAAAEKLLTGAKPSKELIAQAMREAEKIADPNPDNRGSAEFKKAMAGVLTGRAITAALERLGVGGLR
ncbi:MAG TPA: xanthine dehydrogenase family protein subunit M [Candidatus Cybelea sp.]|jgi:carbon-monoxide dehydrogenase medium subunit